MMSLLLLWDTRLLMHFVSTVKGPKALTDFSAPADLRGTRVLVLGRTQMYIYLPAFRKIRRIASHVNQQSIECLALLLVDVEPIVEKGAQETPALGHAFTDDMCDRVSWTAGVEGATSKCTRSRNPTAFFSYSTRLTTPPGSASIWAAARAARTSTPSPA